MSISAHYSSINPGADRVKEIDIRGPFNLKFPEPFKMQGGDREFEETPCLDPNYVFEGTILNDFIRFDRSNETAIKLIGHTGTGKSSFVEQFYARLNRKLFVVNATPRMTFEDLIGGFVPTEDGTLKYHLGAVSLAALHGCAVLIDEYNVIHPGEGTGLNAILEGRRFYVREIGEWINPQPGFKVIGTCNPKSPGYMGRNTQDAANDDRWSYIYFDYMSEENEIKLLSTFIKQYRPEMDDEQVKFMAKNFRKVASQVRNLFIGGSDSADALDTTISTRSLISWVCKYFEFASVKSKHYSPVHYALERAKTLCTSDESRIAIHKLVQAVFNENYNTPFTEAKGE